MLTKSFFKKSYLLLLNCLIFLIPSNLFFKFNVSSAYVNGLLIDYLIPKVYLSDIFILILLALWLIEVILKKTKIKFSKPTSLIPSIIISIFIIRQIFTPYPLASAWYLCKMIELSLLTLFLIDHRRLFSLNSFKWTVVLTLIFQSSLSWWQFITQRSLYGFILLGEPNLSHSIGLAKDLWWQTGRVLPYGTTAHPNILGGTIVVLSLLLIRVKQSLLSQSEKNTVNLVIIISCITLVLTQSISALLSFIIGILILTMPKIDLSSCKFGGGLFIILIPLLISFAASKLSYDDSLTRRSYLQTAAVKMTINHPLAGVGLNQFTARVEEYSPTKEIVRFVQPVHHIGLLFLAETGILGIMILGIMMRLSQIYPNPIPLITLLPIITLDHYLLTQQTGLLLLIFALVLVKRTKFMAKH